MSPSNLHNRKRVRRIEYLDSIQYKYYIFCEGVQTEPLYFKGFAEAISNNPVFKNLIHVEAIGVGAETLRVIYAAERYIEKNKLHNSNIWCVYDKDSFPSQDFNAVAERIAELNSLQDDMNYFAAWSNQCIEYWFILHFDWYVSDNDRKYYRKFLHNKFAQLGWTRYEKSNEQLFNILSNYGKPKQAIEWAKKRLNECCGLSDSKSVPATKVHLLVSELAKYLPDEMKSKYL